jgi:hypothetical protein
MLPLRAWWQREVCGDLSAVARGIADDRNVPKRGFGQGGVFLADEVGAARLEVYEVVGWGTDGPYT